MPGPAPEDRAPGCVPGDACSLLLCLCRPEAESRVCSPNSPCKLEGS